MALEIGVRAPLFSLLNQFGEEVSLQDFGDSWLVLYFYPRDNTPGCTVEAVDFTSLKEDFAALGCQIVGVSPDSVASHEKFCAKQNLKIILLSDPDKKVLEAYGAYGLKKNYGREYMGVLRSTVLIDPNGTVVYVWRNVRAKEHAAKVLERLRALR